MSDVGSSIKKEEEELFFVPYQPWWFYVSGWNTYISKT